MMAFCSFRVAVHNQFATIKEHLRSASRLDRMKSNTQTVVSTIERNQRQCTKQKHDHQLTDADITDEFSTHRFALVQASQHQPLLIAKRLMLREPMTIRERFHDMATVAE